MYVLMVCCWVVLGEIIRSIVYSSLPKDVELSLSYTVTDPIKVHIDALDRFCLMLSFAIVQLLCCYRFELELEAALWPNSCNVLQIGLASLPLWNNAANSASAALDTTSRMMLHRTLMAPLPGGGGSLGPGGLVGSCGWLLRNW
jgi:hypothetical protein